MCGGCLESCPVACTGGLGQAPTTTRLCSCGDAFSHALHKQELILSPKQAGTCTWLRVAAWHSHPGVGSACPYCRLRQQMATAMMAARLPAALTATQLSSTV